MKAIFKRISNKISFGFFFRMLGMIVEVTPLFNTQCDKILVELRVRQPNF